MSAPKYKRVLLKLSGEALMGESQEMFDSNVLREIVYQIKQVVDVGVKLGIVVGGGNIFRGVRAEEFGLQRANADYMGMIATIMNGIALKDFFSSYNIQTKIYSALPIGNLIKGYNRDSMMKCLDADVIAIFVAGTGNPFFTTDSGAALRAIEMNADLLIKATKVNGIYDCDPKTNPKAHKYEQISFNDVIRQNLQVMDMSAFDLCRTYKINIEVCNIFSNGSLKDAVLGNSQGTLVSL